MPTPTVSFQLSPTTLVSSAKRLLRTSDGDTPVVEQPIRMVSCDTPEESGYAGWPEKAQPKLDERRARLTGKYYPDIPDTFSTLRSHGCVER